MVCAHQAGFEISHRRMWKFRIDAALERTLGHRRTLLPKGAGFVNARAMYALDMPGRTHLVVQGIWGQWEDLQAYQNSGLAEQQALSEFEPQVALDDLTVHV